MALTTDPKRALLAAIDRFLVDAADDPQHKDLLGSLKTLREGQDSEPTKAAPRDGADDAHSFDAAEKRHGERLAAQRAALAGIGTDGGEGK